MSDPIARPGPARKPPKRLKMIGVIVLLLGLAGAGTVDWIGIHSAEPSEDELFPGKVKAESRQMEILYGKVGLLTMELSDDLKHPATQAFLIATVSILVAGGCFYLARMEDTNEEVH